MDLTIGLDADLSGGMSSFEASSSSRRYYFADLPLIRSSFVEHRFDRIQLFVCFFLKHVAKSHFEDVVYFYHKAMN